MHFLFRKAGLYLCVFTCIILMASCSSKPKPQENLLRSRSGNFDTTANISYKDLKATAGITRDTPQSCSVSFESPQSLSDMSFIFREECVELSYKGLSFSFDPSSLPGGAVAGMTIAAINKAMRDDGVSIDYSDGVLTLSGMLESGEFFLRLDSDSGNLIKLSVPSEELEIEFVNFKFLN